MTPTVRKYPRTAAEAFKGPEYATAIRRYPGRNRARRALWLGLLTLNLLIVGVRWLL